MARVPPNAYAWLACCFLVACSAYDAGLTKYKPRSSHEDGGQDDVDAGPTRMPDAAILSSCEGAEDYSICIGPSSQGVCISGECTIIHCEEGHFDCDGDAQSGCEETLTSSSHCRACGASCALKHVKSSVCAPDVGGGPCLIDHGCHDDELGDCRESSAAVGCEDGWGDCDGIDANGCETSLRSPSNCGSCGMTCTLASGEASCESGECKFVACKPTFADCGAGCISLSDNPQHCGACNSPCAAPNKCAGGRCSAAQCAANMADCDGNASNGCEADLTSAGNCGACGVKCGPYAQAQGGCNAGQCAITSCNAAYANCDGQRDNGCETNLGSVEDCGSCGNDCAALPRVTGAQCSAGKCASLVCEAGWGDCDGRSDNGCEQPLNTNDHCGSCSGTCNPAHAAGSCSTGSCKIASCSAGYDDCAGGVADGCEAALNGNANCGSCGNACPSGQTCQGGGCACNSGACADGNECCGGACVDTRSECVPWPCIPGTTKDKNNCGGCGVKCAGWCCTAF
ncbi:MAG TPA: hypothetical protein VJV78_15290 [Polyangiales bacterium]|nr:hypothetical protein [Polyangiales bacterium]